MSKILALAGLAFIGSVDAMSRAEHHGEQTHRFPTPRMERAIESIEDRGFGEETLLILD